MAGLSRRTGAYLPGICPHPAVDHATFMPFRGADAVALGNSDSDSDGNGNDSDDAW